MLLSSPSRGLSIKKVPSQTAHYETKNFTEMITKHFKKFEKKIDGYFLSQSADGCAYIRKPFTANAQILQTKHVLVKLQYYWFARNVYSEK